MTDMTNEQAEAHLTAAIARLIYMYKGVMDAKPAVKDALNDALEALEAGDKKKSEYWIAHADKLESRYKTDYGVHYLDVIAQPINGANAGC